MLAGVGWKRRSGYAAHRARRRCVSLVRECPYGLFSVQPASLSPAQACRKCRKIVELFLGTFE